MHMKLSEFIREFPAEQAGVKPQLVFLFREIGELLQALLHFNWQEARLEAQQVVQCKAYLFKEVGMPAGLFDWLTPLQREYMDLSLERAILWDSAREQLAAQGLDWRMPGRCCRSPRHFVERMSILFPEIPPSRWEEHLSNSTSNKQDRRSG